MRKLLFFIPLLLIWSCSKEFDLRDIDGIDEAIAGFETELRIEAILYPADNTAVVRIDRSYSLAEDSLYNCIDDNGNWASFTDENNNGVWDDGEPLNDDLGEDGQEGDPDDEDKDLNLDEPSKGEGNGLPDCGEPNVDEYAEVLPQVHVDDCESVRLIDPWGQVHELTYSDSAARLISYPEYSDNLDNAEYYWYGGYVPEEDDLQFNLSSNPSLEDRTWQFVAECGDYGEITAVDTIALPVRFYGDSLGVEPLLGNIDNYPEIDDILNQGDCTIDNFMFIFMSDEEFSTQPFFYYSQPETRSFWVTANEVSAININSCAASLNYIFGYAAFTPPGGEMLGDSVHVIQDVIAEIPGIYQFNVKAMSPAYEHYFVFADLDLHDPVKSNLRDENNNVIMGTFGGLTSSDLFIIVLPPPYLSLRNGELEEDETSGRVLVRIDSYIRSGNFHFRIDGLNITGVEGGYVGDNPNWEISISEDGVVTGTTLNNSYILSGEKELLYLTFESYNGGNVCISDAEMYMPMADEVITVFTGPCVTIP